ncbi:transmembrane and ubiquitin-like domain-containing protein 1 isoform X3 [Coccinella septempunctata]|uniref:transmembrane and ubiquitin-like domain-containing protein 1 isoform X3 n=1 Tax=Coccinella septempunctata TaxID=41139 RepID=UPI001D094CE8|nr:transmembrane and ubiquitin-like domain-containing protein 1 isoform X3 [Coccinella septempunctata]
MTLIEGIGDEVVQFFVGLFFLLVVLAWCTTNTTNDGTFRTVFLLERRRLRAVRRLITHTESSTIVEGTTEENLETNQTSTATEEDKPTSTSTDSRRNSAGEETRIVETMDAPNSSVSDGLRKRVNLNVNIGDESNNPSSIDGDSTVDTNRSNDSREAAGECLEPEIKAGSSREVEENENKIRVKLKYVTDELRHVDANLKENIGDFKKRHFQVEFAANKVVKLIFNGQIMQRDGDTLQSYGLFDNCVVHCVFLPKANSPSPGEGSGSRDSNSSPHGTDSHSNNHNQPNEWHLENYLLAILCWFLGAAWYLRYAYSQLYTVTATIGLILMTGIFTIIMFGIHFPENEELNNQRTENARTQ